MSCNVWISEVIWGKTNAIRIFYDSFTSDMKVKVSTSSAVYSELKDEQKEKEL